MKSRSTVQQFVLLPPRGLSAVGPASTAAIQDFLVRVTRKGFAAALSPEGRAPRATAMRVVDSIHENGAKLVEMSAEAVLAVKASQPGLRLVPIVYYKPARAPEYRVAAAPRVAARAVGVKILLKVVSGKDGRPVSGAMVVAFTDFAARTGAQGTTNARGEVRLGLGTAKTTLQRLYVYPEAGFWGALKKTFKVSSGVSVALDPVDLSYSDGLRHFYGNAADSVGSGVKVGVIDTGIDLHHPDVSVSGGENTVVGEQPADFGDNGQHHGTHVAGIIGAHGKPPTGIRGMAPAVQLFSFRVFGKGSENASNYSIAKAIDRAAAAGCDLINMSLGGPDVDEATRSAIGDARNQGSLVIVAAGNDSRGPVSFPAADPLSVAVSAMGRVGTFPAGSIETGDVAAPYGTDKKNFLADFSNIGPEIDVTGPGVGILSTVPGGYAPMDGTSMACPAVTGAAARLLAGNPAVLAMNRDPARSDKIAALLYQSAKPLGLGLKSEGHGLPG